MRERFFIVLCLFVSAVLASASSGATWSVPQFSGRVWHIDHGLPKNTINSIAQTPDGYLWIGTPSGLARFDGEQFEWIDLPSSDSEFHQWVNAFSVTSDGTLWICSGGQGLYEYKNGTFKQHLPGPDLNLVILSISEEPNGSLLCGTRKGLLRYRNGVFEAIGTTNSAKLAPENRVAVTTIRSIAREPNGNFLVAVPGEILELSGNTVSSKYDMRDVNADPFVRCIFSDKDGTIWIGSNAGLTKVKDGVFTHYTKTDGLPDNTVNTIYRDRNNNLWIGTFGGICRLIDDKFVITTGEDGEPYDQILCFFEDRENNLWAGGKDGLCQLNLRQFYTLTTRHGLSHNNVISVYEDHEKTLWVGTWGGGLNYIRDGKINSYSSENTKVLKNDLILALQGTRDGALWVGTDYDGGLYQFKNDQFHAVPPNQASTNAIRTMIEDNTGRLWIGTVAGGLASFQNNKFSHYGKKEISNGAIRCLYQTKDDYIWVGTENGLFRSEGKHFTYFDKDDGLGSNYILSLYEDNTGSLWIGTSEGGLSRYRDGKFKTYTTKDGLFDDSVLEILEDNNQTLWLTCFRGIFSIKREEFDKLDRHEIKTVSGRSFGKDDGMASAVCISSAKPAAWKAADGRLWFATTKGLIVTDPSMKVEKNTAIPSVLIRKVIAGKVEQPVTDLIKIEPGRDDLEFHYTALSYRDPEKNEFKYKLEGFDAEWRAAQQRKVAYYNNLPPGNYTFHVIAANNDGVWNNAGASIAFVLPPQFWQTLWFRSASILLSLWAVGFGARIYTKRRMQRRLKLLEQQHAIEKERARIAQDMHDEVGAKLTKITFLGSTAKQRLGTREEAEVQIEKISQTARDLIGALDEIVWAVDPKNDTLENFASYLCRYASEFFDNSSVLCELQIPTQLPHVSLTADVRHNVFLAIKESLNNALKHSKASKVIVGLSTTETTVEVVVRDNGTGIPISKDANTATKRVGNGLRNMQHRLNSVGGTCKLDSIPGEGTTVSFLFHIKPSQKRQTSVS